MMKICENHHERFHSKRATISARWNDLKYVAIFGQDVPIAGFIRNWRLWSEILLINF